MKNIDLPMLLVWGGALCLSCGAFYFAAKIIGIL